MKLEIPDHDRTLLATWLGGDDQPIDKVLAFLESARPVLQPDHLVRQMATATGIDEAVAKDLLLTFFRLARTVSQLSSEERNETKATILRHVMDDAVDSERGQKFEKRVERILQAKSIEITGKAHSVYLDHANTFYAARTLSELRPVFSDDGLEPTAAVLVHQLKLVYHAGPEMELNEIFIAVDRNDLEGIKSVIERAIAKHEKLEALTSKLELPLL